MAGMFYATASAEVNHPPRAEPASARAKSHPANSAGYVGSTACSRCHAGIYDQFSKTSMGRSVSSTSNSTTSVMPDFLHNVPLSASIYDEKFDRHFEVHTEGGKLFQSEYQLDANGHEVFRNTHAIEWIVGANLNGLSALIKRGDYIFEAPLSYYDKTGKWDLSPGYQRGDYGFNRVVRNRWQAATASTAIQHLRSLPSVAKTATDQALLTSRQWAMENPTTRAKTPPS